MNKIKWVQIIQQVKLSKKHWLILGVGLVTFFFYVQAVTWLAKLSSLDNYLVIYNSSGIAHTIALQAGEQNTRQKNVYEFTTWREQDGITVENVDLHRSVNDVTKLSLYGSTSLLFRNTPTLERTDYTGCLIDGKTAMSLFGMIDVVGQVVRHANNDYIVRGVIPNMNFVFVTQITPYVIGNDIEEGERLPKLDTVTIRTDDRLLSQIKTDFSLMGIDGNEVPFRTIKGLLYSYLLIIPISLMIILLCLLWKYVKGAIISEQELFLRKYPVTFWFWALLFTFIFVILLWQLIQHIALPQDVVPPKWSNFDFWGNLFKEKKQEVAFFFKIPKRTHEMFYVWAIIRVILYGTLALFGFLVTLFGVVKKTSNF